MATHFISESRIRIKALAAARYWIKNCSEAPPLALNGAEMAAEVSAEVSPPGEGPAVNQDLQSKPAEDPPAAKV